MNRPQGSEAPSPSPRPVRKAPDALSRAQSEHAGIAHESSYRRSGRAPAQVLTATDPSGLVGPGRNARGSSALWDQYSPLITKYEPRMVPASFDFCRANLNEPNSAGTSIPSESLNPTARFGSGPSSVYRTLIESPLS